MKIVAVEQINGRLMVEMDVPSGDGACRILTQEEMEDIDQKLQERLALIDACRAVDAEMAPYVGPSWEAALKMVSEALAELT